MARIIKTSGVHYTISRSEEEVRMSRDFQEAIKEASTHLQGIRDLIIKIHESKKSYQLLRELEVINDRLRDITVDWADLS